ncbi:MAG: peroxiredoxin [Bacteroidota bacterium]|nr:peroxiredoxin [Bacteroidota bacterium]
MKTLIISLTIWGLLLFGTTPLSTLSAQNAHKVEVGSPLPGFKLPDQNGKLFDVHTVLGKKNLVIYFYPKDGTPGCTKEACSFRDNLKDFTHINAMIIGISGDDVASHKQFVLKNHLNFTLLSDKDNKIRKLFGVPASMMGTIPGRVTYIVNKKGIVVHVYNSQTRPEQHIREALSALKYEKQ